jgi:hypothetical protein
MSNRRFGLSSRFFFCVLLTPAMALAHAERPTLSPVRPGSVPDQNRVPAAVLNVCKTGDPFHGPPCFRHIQDAVNAASVDGTLIQIWPGLYKEEPFANAPTADPDMNGLFSYKFHFDHPNGENLIQIMGETAAADGSPSGIGIPGKKNLTLRGMGKNPRDVVIDVEFKKHVGIRGDNADGLIIENLSVWHAYDHGVYVLDTDGFVLDNIHSGFSRDYAFLTFADDHGLMKNCEAFGAGDAGIYPGGSANPPGRFSQEIANCSSHDNVLGYSGTNGDSVWVHDTVFYNNAVGLVSDSETDHPNYPENHMLFERNLVYDNNLKVYGANANIKATVFENSILIPVGVGVFLASGNDNLVQNNQIWGNDRYGVWLASAEGLVIGPTSTPAALPFASSGNRFIGNRMYPPEMASPGASSKPNGGGSPFGADFAWDGMGLDNCWQSNTASPDGSAASGNPMILPPCDVPVIGGPMPITAAPPNVQNLLEQGALMFVDGPNGPEPLCHILGLPPCDWEPGPPACPRNLPDSSCNQSPPTPTACGPSTCS